MNTFHFSPVVEELLRDGGISIADPSLGVDLPDGPIVHIRKIYGTHGQGIYKRREGIDIEYSAGSVYIDGVQLGLDAQISLLSALTEAMELARKEGHDE